MSEKVYSPKEAALAVLAKAEEMLKKAEINKKANKVEKQIDPHKNPHEKKEGNNLQPGQVQGDKGIVKGMGKSEEAKELKSEEADPAMPRLIGSAKLAKFMEHIAAKRGKK
jgi:hypothetical protein